MTPAPTVDELLAAIRSLPRIDPKAVVTPSMWMIEAMFPDRAWPWPNPLCDLHSFAGLPVYVIPTEPTVRVVPLDEAKRLAKEWEELCDPKGGA